MGFFFSLQCKLGSGYDGLLTFIRHTIFFAFVPSYGNTDSVSQPQIPGPQTKRRPEKGGKLNTSQAGSVAASRAAVGQFLSISREAFILRTRYTFLETKPNFNQSYVLNFQVITEVE